MSKEKKATILIVEDSPTQSVQLEYLLEENGYSVITARNGAEAITCLQEKRPDLIISDIIMPVMDGYEFCTAVKRDDDLKDIPVMLLTALSDPLDVINGLKSGADNFLTKPYRADFLLSRIQHLLINWKLRESKAFDTGIEIFFGGEKHHITSDRIQIIDLLLSTFDNAIQKNRELEETNRELKAVQDDLRELNEELEDKVLERTGRIDHLNKVLKAIRNINRLIVKERDRDRLISQACEDFIQSRGYHSAWILLIDGNGKLTVRAGAGGNGKVLSVIREFPEMGGFECMKGVLERPGIEIIDNPVENCGDCPLLPVHGDQRVMLIRIAHRDRVYGILTVSLNRDVDPDAEEQELLEEIAGDIAFALYDIELEERHHVVSSALSESEEQYRLHFENITDVIISVGPDHRIINVTPSVERMLGYTPEELINESIDEISILTHESQERMINKIKKVFSGDPAYPTLFEFVSRDRTRRFAEVGMSPICREGTVRAIIMVARDITDRKEAEKWLLMERLKMDRVMKTSPAGITVVTQEGQIIFANPRAEEILGLKRDEIELRTYNDPGWKITDFDGTPVADEDLPFQKVLRAGTTVYDMFHAIEKNGDERTLLSINGAPIMDESGQISEVVFSIEDVTERMKAEESIRKSLREKEVLLQEIHHRVKNNLQVVSSMLSLQSSQIQDEKFRTLFKDSENRVRTMALIHEKLYLSEDLSSIDFGEYISGLLGHLIQIYQVDPSKIKITTTVDNISFGIETAIPLGLIINELVSNSLKYAFTGDKLGEISITLKRMNKTGFSLIVCDNGVGLPESLTIDDAETLGLQLVDILSKQLDGTVVIDRDGGTKFTIIFKELKYKRRF